jgi:hypothetical protein
MGTIIRLLTTLNELEEKKISICPKEIMQIFLVEEFFHLPPVSNALMV